MEVAISEGSYCYMTTDSKRRHLLASERSRRSHREGKELLSTVTSTCTYQLTVLEIKGGSGL